MKKLILASLLMSVIVACKKSDIADATNSLNTADSLLAEAQQHINTIDSVAKNMDSVSLPQLIKEKEKIGQVFDDHKKSLDSLTTKISEFKNDIDKEKIQKSIDSIKTLVKKEPIKKAKETITKIIYKDKNLEKKPETPKQYQEPNLVKSGQIELNVENLALAKDQIKEELEKFDAQVKTENLTTNDEFQTYYMTAKVPLQKFDYLVQSLSENIGKVKTQNLEVKGSLYNDNVLCNLEITLSQNPGLATSVKPESFSGKTWSAIGAGGDALGNIFLFLLPFWPIFLIAGIGYYFYKKRQNKTPESPQE